MSISFENWEKTISWFYVKFDDNKQRKKFANHVFSYFSGFSEIPYLGVYFGKYARVLEFSHSSSKVASFRLVKLQSQIASDGISCSISTMLCKPLKGYSYCTESFPSINAYSFFKPNIKIVPNDKIFSVCKEINENPSIDVEPYWNNSTYPIMLIFRGDDYHKIVESIIYFRNKINWIIDSSSYITLKIDPKTNYVVKDKTKDKFPALIFIKLASLSDINNIQVRFANMNKYWDYPLWRFGWFDLCDLLYFNNLYELLEHIEKIRKLSKDNIKFTSSLILKEGY